jgi:hypothetical protein
MLVSAVILVVDPNNPLERQMSKRKPATASKHARSPKIAAKAQRATQAVIRSTKDNRQRPVGVRSNQTPPKRHDDAQQEALPVENAVTAVRDDSKQAMTDNDWNKGVDFSSATANVRAFQAKLLEIGQTNMQFAFEFAQRLATIRSPVEFPSVIAEFTSKRIAIFRKHSTELAKISIQR